MSSLTELTAQILDKLSDLVIGPSQGTLIATTTQSALVIVPQGTVATLPNGRKVRVLRSVRVSTTGAVPVRLLSLVPTIPAGNNVAIGAGQMASWLSPPAGLAPTALTSAFGPNAAAAGLKLASVAYWQKTWTDADYFSAGAQGTNFGVLFAPDTRRTSKEQVKQRWSLFEATYTARFVFGGLDPQTVASNQSSECFDGIVEALEGATVGNGPVRIDRWRPLAPKDNHVVYELTFAAQYRAEGRTMQPAPGSVPFGGLDTTIFNSGDNNAPDPFEVRDVFPHREFNAAEVNPMEFD